MVKILIIEDEYEVRSSIRELLESNNYKVFSASDGIEGVELAKEITPDLIICDILMPKMTGYEVIETLMKEPEFAAVPFLFLTAKAEMTDFREGMELGADDYITKPFKAVNLLKAIETRLNKYETIKELQNNSNKESDNDTREALSGDDRILVNINKKSQFLKIKDILYITAEREYSYIHLITGEKYLTRKLIKKWEEQLSSKTFLRIRRSKIVNIDFIEKIEKWSNRSYIVILKNCEEKFIISQRYSTKIKTMFNI
jgi:DNA-binding LytR/AlgR family response regulator